MRQQSTDTAGAYTAQAHVGFQGRGLADGAQPDFCHSLLLEALIFQTALKMSYDSRTMVRTKIRRR